MDHTEKLELTMNSENDPVYLTPDDILTLKLLRDFLREHTLGNWKTTERNRQLETLERILKQVG